MRLDKLIDRLLPQAEAGFKFKMLRKKNIVLNGKKAAGRERVAEGDIITFYLSDETFNKFKSVPAWTVTDGNVTDRSATGGSLADTNAANRSDMNASGTPERIHAQNGQAIRPAAGSFKFEEHIVYEDGDVILVSKPAGILTQKAQPGDISLNEYLIDYLLRAHKISAAQLVTFKPSVCNRLDRNTEGLVCCGISITGLRVLSQMFRDRTVRKFYLAVVKGELKSSARRKAWLVKDESDNKVRISGQETEGAELIETAWRPVRTGEEYTLAEVELFTGKSHQIRAHLASIGYPIAGDVKYGDSSFNDTMRRKYGTKGQLLVAYRIVFPMNDELSGISGREFRIDPFTNPRWRFADE